MHATVQEKRIWDTSKGDILVAKQTMLGDNYPYPDAPYFTQGAEYEVVEVLPLAPCVVVIDDQGHRNNIDGDFIVNFERKPAAR